MILTGYNGVLFSAVGVKARIQDTTSPGPDRSVSVIPRIAASPYATGVSQGAQTLAAVFTVATGGVVETSLMALLAVLNPDDPNPRTLTGSLITGTAVETTAYVGRWSYPNVNQISVEFVVVTPGWRATAATTLRTLSAATANGTITNGNTGYRELLPVVTVAWPGVTNRAASTSTFGWKTKLPITITNTGVEPIFNQPYQLGPWNTAGEVSAVPATIRADGNDIRLFFEGAELRRNLIGMNTLATLVWFILPDLAPGQAIVVDLVYNNASAGTPPTLTTTSVPPLPAMDISGTSDVTTATTTTGYTVAGTPWETNQWAGATVNVPGNNTMRRIASNTTNAVTYTRATGSALPVGATTVITKSGLQADGGRATSATTTTITDSAQAWNPGEWIGAKVNFPLGTPAGTFTVTANTATRLTVTPSMGTAPALNVDFRVYRPNGIRLWDTRIVPKATPHKGLWLTNKSAAPPSLVNFDAPGSWYRFVYQRSQDAYSQPRYDSFLVGAGDYDHFPVMRIRRARRGKAGLQTEVGVADAIGASSPFTILGMTHPYTIRNATKAATAGEGLAEVRVMVQEAGGELWVTAASEVVEHNTTVSGVTGPYFDLTGYGSPNRVAFTLIPNAADEIDEADNNTAELRTNGDYVALNVDPTGAITESMDWFSGSISPQPCYDVSLIVRTGGSSATRPYSRLVIGGTGRRIFIAATNERIVVDCATHLASLVTSGGTLVRRVPYAVALEDVVDDPDGVTQTLVAATWLPIPPTVLNTATIAYSDPSGAGWGSLDLGVTGRLGYLS